MAVVFRARDAKHGRDVAIKVLRPEIAPSLGTERFLREIQLEARLQHPHILPLHDSGEAAGLLYYVMPFVRGESLRERLRRDKQLPLDEAYAIAGEVAEALAHAHGQGIVHRDIKPENILLSGGHAVVADFGIARAVSVAGSEQVTDSGIVIGTPQYMSPEQASGRDAIDGRSDLYSLGCVVYEMLVGEPPFTGPTGQAIVSKQMLERPPSLRVVRDAVPDAVEKAVMRALAKAPADRFAATTEFAQALREPELPIPPPVWTPQRVAAVTAAIVVAAALPFIVSRVAGGASLNPDRYVPVSMIAGRSGTRLRQAPTMGIRAGKRPPASAGY
jgi:serine/threonine-protein kinase